MSFHLTLSTPLGSKLSLLIPLYRWVNWGTDVWNLLKVTKLVRAMTWEQGLWPRGHYPHFPGHDFSEAMTQVCQGCVPWAQNQQLWLCSNKTLFTKRGKPCLMVLSPVFSITPTPYSEIPSTWSPNLKEYSKNIEVPEKNTSEGFYNLRVVKIFLSIKKTSKA